MIPVISVLFHIHSFIYSVLFLIFYWFIPTVPDVVCPDIYNLTIHLLSVTWYNDTYATTWWPLTLPVFVPATFVFSIAWPIPVWQSIPLIPLMKYCYSIPVIIIPGIISALHSVRALLTFYVTDSWYWLFVTVSCSWWRTVVISDYLHWRRLGDTTPLSWYYSIRLIYRLPTDDCYLKWLCCQYSLTTVTRISNDTDIRICVMMMMIVSSNGSIMSSMAKISISNVKKNNGEENQWRNNEENGNQPKLCNEENIENGSSKKANIEMT